MDSGPLKRLSQKGFALASVHGAGRPVGGEVIVVLQMAGIFALHPALFQVNRPTNLRRCAQKVDGAGFEQAGDGFVPCIPRG
jgi:hypothetical protein